VHILKLRVGSFGCDAGCRRVHQQRARVQPAPICSRRILINRLVKKLDQSAAVLLAIGKLQV
jgi:hypothetical protein